VIGWIAASVRTLLRRIDLRSRRGRLTLTAGCGVLLCLGGYLIVAALTGQHHAPRPSAAAGIEETPRAALSSTPSRTGGPRASSAAASPSTSSSSAAKATPLAVPDGYGSNPVQITIPSIKVHANVMLLGLAADRTVETPPLSRVGEAGWYRYSPTPGTTGPSVLLGHVDSAVYGRGVFFDLGAMHQGDVVSILRADHRVATFAVTRVVEYPKKSFPTQAVYGNTPNAQIRLITCGGRFDSHARSYVDNIVVFATLTSLRRQ
jgi:sortase (surface protein transpeptidase)